MWSKINLRNAFYSKPAPTPKSTGNKKLGSGISSPELGTAIQDDDTVEFPDYPKPMSSVPLASLKDSNSLKSSPSILRRTKTDISDNKITAGNLFLQRNQIPLPAKCLAGLAVAISPRQ